MENAWQKALRELESELPPFLYEPLLRSVRQLGDKSKDQNRLILEVHDEQLLSQMSSDMRKRIEDGVQRAAGRRVKVDLIAASPQKAVLPAWLNRDFTFERFCQGKSNRFAFMACEAVGNQPGRSNPLFLHSEPGMGKTHLLHGLAVELLQRFPESEIRYVSFGDFRDELARAMRAQNTLEFKDRYRSYDMLVIEDIHELRGTSQNVQEEFYHIFNHYYDRGKQLVFSADRPASELLLNSGLMSRLLSGLQVRIDSPEPALRTQIFDRKCQELGLEVRPEIQKDICQRVVGSVREIESAVNRLYFLSQNGESIDSLAEIRDRLGDLIPDDENLYIPLERIVEAVCERYNITRDQILSNSRKAEYTLPRHIGMYLGIQYSNLNKSAIARFFRKSDHTTVINAERNIQRRIEKEHGFQQILEGIVSELRRSGL